MPNKKIILLLWGLLCGGAVQAQPKFLPGTVIAPRKIEVSYSKTTHILFPAEVKYVDLGSSNIIAGKAAGAENVVRVKAAVRDFADETNFSVITADGSFYSFDVEYKDNPATLSLEVGGETVPESRTDDRVPASRIRLRELSGNSARIVMEDMRTIYRRNERDLRHIGCKRYGVQTLVKGIYIEDDLLYLHLEMTNRSNISYDVEYVRLAVRDKKVARRTAMQETEIVPVSRYNDLKTVASGASIKDVLVIPKFTIAPGKVLEVEIAEKNGGRNQRFCIENRDILSARRIDKKSE